MQYKLQCSLSVLKKAFDSDFWTDIIGILSDVQNEVLSVLATPSKVRADELSEDDDVLRGRIAMLQDIMQYTVTIPEEKEQQVEETEREEAENAEE